ncbi:Huntingtin-interacting K [Pyrenophora seminiperda CCB06]|uniref:Huntingtin-interacting K n=1 Tax=Pyrenophora seminiperda CCB06 TaxID=1302712 RepID=A0A3M7MCJ3_9PLEO|nr:Huntingtin-interacting K [Pyrenophora seminiperda CCB06]
MAEPQPSTVKEGAADPHAPTSTAEDRKAAAALSTLDAQEGTDNGEKKEVDSKALDKAMKGLGVKSSEQGEKKSVKIEASDVTLLVNELEVSKQKATELLRAHHGDAVKAMTAFVMTPP